MMPAHLPRWNGIAAVDACTLSSCNPAAHATLRLAVTSARQRPMSNRSQPGDICAASPKNNSPRRRKVDRASAIGFSLLGAYRSRRKPEALDGSTLVPRSAWGRSPWLLVPQMWVIVA
jgi:hypothetical protein